jgi:DNA-binding transcriptional ArsR family regulator
VQIAEVDLAGAARLLADPSRAAMLTLLLDGRAYPAGALAQAAGIGRPAASAHLQKLLAAGLIEVDRQGRHRYHRITRADVAQAIEALAAIAPPVPVRSLRQSTLARQLAAARTCYDHLAGRAGVALRCTLLDHGVLTLSTPAGEAQTTSFAVSELGAQRLATLGVDTDALAHERRHLVRDCLDWTERLPHLAGALPTALFGAMVERDWVTRRTGRHIEIAATGWSRLQAQLGCSGTCHPAAPFIST